MVRPRGWVRGHELKKEADSWEEPDRTSGQIFTSLVPTGSVLCGPHIERLISFSEFISKALMGDYRNEKEKKSAGRGSLVNEKQLSKV